MLEVSEGLRKCVLLIFLWGFSWTRITVTDLDCRKFFFLLMFQVNAVSDEE